MNMEIKVKIDGKFKVFKQTTVNFKTMFMALEWQEHMLKQQVELTRLATMAIEDSIDEDYEPEVELDGRNDLEFTTQLIVSFFDGQFTYDEFINGVYFQNIGEFYALGSKIYELVYHQKKETEDKQSKKPVSMKPAS